MNIHQAWGIGLVLATTVGAGLFALPYAVHSAGWAWGLLTIVIVAAITNFIHTLYARSLFDTSGERRLVGLARRHLGSGGGLVALVAVAGGIVISLVLYLVLGAQFLTILFPISGGWAIAAMWVISSFPLVFNLKKIFASEFLGALVIGALISAAFFFGFRAEVPPLPVFAWPDLALLFAVALGALAGWPAIGDLVQAAKDLRAEPASVFSAARAGTWLAALLYVLFTAGIILGADRVTPDALSGLNWPVWAVGVLAVLGLFAIWTSYVPSAWEMKDSLSHDLGWSKATSLATALGMPPLLIFIGLTDFLRILNLIGGIFLPVAYILILRIARKATGLRLREILVTIILEVFLWLAAVYELWVFVVQ